MQYIIDWLIDFILFIYLFGVQCGFDMFSWDSSYWKCHWHGLYKVWKMLDFSCYAFNSWIVLEFLNIFPCLNVWCNNNKNNNKNNNHFINENMPKLSFFLFIFTNMLVKSCCKNNNWINIILCASQYFCEKLNNIRAHRTPLKLRFNRWVKKSFQ